MSELCQVMLNVANTSPIQLANGLIEFYVTINLGEKENTLINLEEVADHINAFCKAERKALKKMEDIFN